MRFRSTVAAALALAAFGQVSAAQNDPRIVRVKPGQFEHEFFSYSGASRAAVGITTSSGASVRDTLGVLVSSVFAGSPAEKAGIEEGNRVASVNGVNLKLNPVDVGDDQMAGIMSRRLTRELERLRPGDNVDLRVYANGQTKAIAIKTVESSELYRSTVVRRWDERATLGLNFAVTGSTRDTIGVFVMSVDDGGPAAKSGIEEGSRIASINGVDVRARRGDAEDGMLRSSSLTRLKREIDRLKPGEEADLRVYTSGQMRSLKVKAVSVADLPRSGSKFTIIGGDRMSVPRSEDLNFGYVDGIEIGDHVRRAIEHAMAGAGRGLEGVGQALDALGRGLGRARIVW